MKPLPPRGYRTEAPARSARTLRDDDAPDPSNDPRVQDALERLYRSRAPEPDYGPMGSSGRPETEDAWAYRVSERRDALRDLKDVLDGYPSGWDESDRFH